MKEGSKDGVGMLEGSYWKILLGVMAAVATVILVVPHGDAAEITLVPSLGAKGEYNDNAAFTRTNEQDDYIGTVSPGLVFDYATPLVGFRSRLLVDVLRYADQTQLDTENVRCELDGDYKIVERLKILGRGSYIKDTTLDSELEETGLVGVRSDRKSWTGGGGLEYMVTPIAKASLNYDHVDRKYDWPGYFDYTEDTIEGAYEHPLGDQRNTFAFRPYYSTYDSDASKAHTVGAYVGWFYTITETMNIRAWAGARYAKTEYDVPNTDIVLEETKWGGLADIAFRSDGETTFWTVGYLHDLRYSAEGEPINVDRVYGSGGLRMTSRLRFRLTASYYKTKSEAEFFQNQNRRYAEVTPSLSYDITEDHTLECAYSYSHDYDKTVATDPRKDRNRVWIVLTFRFPQKW